jgi:hypothetical protein
MNTRLSISAMCALVALLAPRPAHAWDWFRSENSDARRGSELLANGQAEAASQAFESAARALPNDPGAQLNRGLGLLATGKLPEAREAFRSATQGGASPEVRGKAHYNMGLAFLREAEAAAGGEKQEEAQKCLREAVDAFKSSLRSAPKNHDAAWNLELAKRRLQEAEQKQKQKEEQEKKEQEKKEQEKKEQDENEQEKGDQQKPDQEQGDQEPQQDSAQNQAPEDKPQDPQDGQPPKDQPKPDDAQKEAGKDGQAPKPEEQGKQPGEKPQAPKEAQGAQPQDSPGDKALPEHMQKALDALSEGDENLQRQQARMRSQQRPRRIEKDW